MMPTYRKWFFAALLVLPGMGMLHAQPSDMHYNAALKFIQLQEADSAKIEIDIVMQDAAAQKDPQDLYLFGYIYKELYKKYEKNNFDSPLRDKAMESFKKSISLDTVKIRINTTKGNMRFLAGTYYNDCVTTLDTTRYATAISCYGKYRDAALLCDTSFNAKKKDIEFDLALASTYNSLYSGNKKHNAKFFDLTKDTYMKVLALDPNNYTANYNLGLLFWNKGVDLMYDIDYGDSLTDVFSMQDHSVDIFKQSLPFAEKAYELDPKREETLIVLSGIYYSLNEFEKSKAYQKMLDDLRNQNHK